MVKDIYTALQKAIGDLGIDVLKSAALVGVLADYHAFEVHDPLLAEKKAVISVLASSCYVDKLEEWKSCEDTRWQSEDLAWIEDFCRKNGLKRVVVGLITDAMKEALGMEVAYTQFSDPKTMLSTEVRKYEDALDKLVTAYTDRLGIKDAYFSLSANTELYRYEGRIKILASAANDKTFDADWMASVRRKVIESRSSKTSQRTEIINNTISTGLDEYKEIIEQQKKRGKDGSDMFGETETERMKEIAEKVNYAYGLISNPNRLDVEKSVSYAKGEVAKYIRMQQVQSCFDKSLADYWQLLKDSLVAETDCLGLVSVHFNSDRETEIVALEKEITSFAKELAVPYDIEVFLKKEKEQILEKNSTSYEQKHSTAKSVIDKVALKYMDLLKEEINRGKKGKKAFEDTMCFSEMAGRINRAFEIIGDKKRIDADEDVAVAKAKIKAYRRKFWIIIAIIALVVGLGIAAFVSDRISYNRHSAEIQKFESEKTRGDMMFAKGDLHGALMAYKEAETGYKADYRQKYYKSNAKEKQDETSQKILEEYSSRIESLLSAGNCKEAKKTYDSLMEMGLTCDLTDFSESFNNSLNSKVSIQKDQLLKKISNQKGKATQSESEELDNLLFCYPDDYYLNMIKSKMP